MATSGEKFLNYNGLVKLIGLLKKAIAAASPTWGTNRFVKSIEGYGTGSAPSVPSNLNAVKNKLEGNYTTGNLDGTGTDTTTNKFTYIDTTYGNATTSKHGLMSKEDKTKLDGIENGGQENVIETVQVNGDALEVTNKTVNVVCATGVRLAGTETNVLPDSSGATKGIIRIPAVASKDSAGDSADANGILTTEQYASILDRIDEVEEDTAANTTKLNGIASGAQVNVIESVKVNNTALTPSNKAVNITAVTGIKNNGDSTNKTGDVVVAKINGKSLVGATSDVELKAGDIKLTSAIGTDYTASQTVQAVLSGINTKVNNVVSTGLRYTVIESGEDLPDVGENNVIYLLPKTGSGDNVYDEFMYIEYVTGAGAQQVTAHRWERIGSTAASFDNYWQKTELIAITNDEIDTAWATTVAAA